MNRKADLEQMESNLIDIWGNYDTFMLQPPTKEEDDIFCMYYGKYRPVRPTKEDPPQHSVADKGTIEKIMKEEC